MLSTHRDDPAARDRPAGPEPGMSRGFFPVPVEFAVLPAHKARWLGDQARRILLMVAVVVLTLAVVVALDYAGIGLPTMNELFPPELD